MKRITNYLREKLFTDYNRGDRWAVILGLLGGGTFWLIVPENPSMWWGIVPASILVLILLFTAVLMWVEWYADKLADEYGELMQDGFELQYEKDERDPDWHRAMNAIELALEKNTRKMHYIQKLRRI